MNLPLFAMMVEGVLSRFSFGAINLALPLYARHLGLGLAEIGLLLSLNSALALALKPASCWAIDHFGQKTSLAASIVLRSLVPFMFAVSGTPGMLYGTAGVHGLSKSVRSPSADSLIVEHSKRNNIGSSFAWYSTLKSVSGSLGKGAAGILLTLTASDFFLVFILAGLISATSLVVVARFVRELRTADPQSRDSVETPEPINARPAGTGKINRSRFFVTLLPFIGFGCFMSGIGHMVDALFPILAVEYGGMSEAEVGIVYMLTTAVVLLAGPVWGWLSDHLSRRVVLIAASIGNALASAIFLVFPFTLGMATGRLVDDVGKAALRPAWGTLMGQLISLNPTRRGQVVGYMGMGKDAGEMAGPIMASLIWSVWGVPVLLGARIALAIGSGIYSMFLLGYIRKLEAEDRLDPETRGTREISRAGRQVQEGGSLRSD